MTYDKAYLQQYRTYYPFTYPPSCATPSFFTHLLVLVSARFGVIIIIIIIIITEIELSLGDSSPFTSTDKANNNKYIFIHSLVFSLEGRTCQEPEPSHVTVMVLAHCILGEFLGVVFHWFPPPLDDPTLAARCLRLQRRERS